MGMRILKIIWHGLIDGILQVNWIQIEEESSTYISRKELKESTAQYIT